MRWKYFIAGIGLIAIMGVLLYLEGRIPFCACGTIRLWDGLALGPENSQQLFDWYSLTHILHGLLIYLLLYLVDRKKRLSFGARLLIAIGIEGAWEIIENSSLIIDRYRATTISLGYYGDTILNSVGDVLCMAAGFYFAYRMPIWMSAALLVIIELGLAYAIRDNLTLNIIMLIHPAQAIRIWQGGG